MLIDIQQPFPDGISADGDLYALHQHVSANYQPAGMERRGSYIWTCSNPDQPGHYVVRSRLFPRKYGTPVPSVQVGEQFDFTLRASPYWGSKPVMDFADRILWLHQRQQRNGFALKGLPLVVGHGRPCRRNGKSFIVNDVVYRGRLGVTDAEKFESMLELGIGDSKAFGYGLMQIKEAQWTH